MSFGLSEKNEDILKRILSRNIASGQVIVYGSRAKGNFTERSDIDLVIKGSGRIDDQIIAEIKEEIDESDFPYLADVQYYENIKNPSLAEHIDRAGKLLLKIS